MNTSDLVDSLSDNWDMSKAETRRLLDLITGTLKDHLAEGRSFTVPDLGTFGTHTREERKSYNPHYEQYMMLPPKRVVDYTPSKGLKEDLKHLDIENE